MAASGRRHSGYSYEVPNQWQGRFAKLEVLGDKRGARSALAFYQDPGLLDLLKRKIDKELKFVHVIRNPYDVLATMTRRSSSKTLDTNIDIFFTLCSGIIKLKNQLSPAQMFDLRLEFFVDDPKLHLRRLCSFMGSMLIVVTLRIAQGSCSNRLREAVSISDGVANLFNTCVSK